MIMKKKISPERLIELEEMLSEIEYNDKNAILEIFKKKGLNQNEVDYLLDAQMVPMSDIRQQLAIYDSTRPLMDELIFVRNLQEKYGATREAIIKRIRHARIINKYLKRNPNVEFPKSPSDDKPKSYTKKK